MKAYNKSWVALGAAFLFAGVTGMAACGDDGGSGDDDDDDDDDDVTIDAAPDVDAPPEVDAAIDASTACVVPTIGVQDVAPAPFSPPGPNYANWRAPIAEDLSGAGGENYIQWEFYAGFGKDSFVGTFDLASETDGNYATCATCIQVLSLDADGAISKRFFQSGGSITLSADPLVDKRMIGSVNGLSLVEVTVDPETFESTPVDGGACIAVGDLDLDADHIPNTWTCNLDQYGDGVTCDCDCGAPDPDCDIVDAPVAGCKKGQICTAGVCEVPPLPPANDTCASADAIALASPTIGTTLGAASDTNLGLEVCTGFSQAGGDVMYALTLDAPINLTITLGDLTFDGSISILGPGDATVCDGTVACPAGAGADDHANDGQPETFNFAAVAGTYYLVVDSFSTDAGGTFTLTVTETPPTAL